MAASTEQRLSRSTWLWALAAGSVLGLIAAIAYWWATGGIGIGFTPDSLQYIGASRSLLAGKGFLSHTGTVYAVWPPLLPLALAAAQLFSSDVLAVARVSNAILFFLLGPLTVSLCLRASRSLVPSILCGAFTVSSPVMFMNFGHVWSEPLFIVLMLGASLAALGYLQDYAKWMYWLSALLSGLVCVDRYLGIAFVVAVVLTIALLESGTLKRRAVVSVGYGAIAAVPIMAWMVRNKLLVGEFGGGRAAASYTFSENAEMLWRATLAALSATGSARPLVVAAAVGATVLGLAVLWIRRRMLTELPSDRRAALVLAALTPPCYAALLVVVATMSGTEISDRILSPLVPFLLALVVGVLSLAGSSEKRALQLVATVSLSVVLALATFGVTLRPTLHELPRWRSSGFRKGFNQKSWHQSPVLAWLEQHAGEGRVLSTVPPLALDLLTDGRVTAEVARRSDNDVLQLPDGEPLYFARFERFPKDSALPVIASPARYELVESTPDGEIYRIVR